ncbi:MAG TPA: D-alanyl-D-alanine carboxypeptidase [Clostridiaceae bacterium]|jgi:D-alanyl-D-alanine carboxypeptidase (penicillin-binding protein 5/6)|nr:D-alanyl-D-alanine carboxypeptidase [Clostridiaceae bacterium]
MKGKCRFILSLTLAICLASGITAFAEGYDALTGTYDSEISIMTIESPEDKSENVSTVEDETSGATPQFKVNAKAAILIEADTGTVLFSFNEHEPLPIASITKIMTMLLVMEAVDTGKITLSQSTTISAYASKMGGSQVYLKEGEVFTVEELLKAVAVHSANDASVALAEVIAGSEEAFVAMMNQKAQELKMKNTKFLDCTGLTDDGHYSTAYDISVMSRELLTKHPKIVHYTTIWHDTFRDGKFDLDNTNKLVKRYRGTTGLKTGFTSKAGFCLSASAEREGTKFISVILGSDSNDHRFSETARLLDFAFSNWETARIEKKDMDAGTIKVKKGVVTEIPVVFSDNAVVVVNKGSKSKITETVEMPEIINAPVKAGQSIGVLNIDLEGEILASIDIVAAKDSPKCTFGLIFGMIARKWAALFC